MDILKTLSSQAEQAEVYEITNESTLVSFENNQLKSSKVEQTSGKAVRLIKDGRLGFAASTLVGGESKLVQAALQTAAFGEALPLQFAAPQAGARVRIYDQAIVNMPIPRMVDMGREIIDMLLAVDSSVQVNVEVRRSVQETTILNHTGTEAVFRRSPIELTTEISRIEGDDVLLLYTLAGATTAEEDLLEYARQLCHKLELSKRVVSMKSGRMPVLFSPTGAAALGLPILQGVNGKNIYKGISPMKGRVGEPLFDEKITITDDGTLDGRLGSAPYDDEGVARRRNVLIEKGVLQGFLWDLRTAFQAGENSTGNGSRTLFATPEPAPSNLVFAAGYTPLAEMVAGIDHGLLVEDVMGLGQGNIISGAFSNPLAVALLIEKGEIVGRVKDASIAGNIYEVLKDVAALSQERAWVYNTIHMPYMLLPEMNVVVKE